MELAIINESKEILVIVKNIDKYDFETISSLTMLSEHIMKMVEAEKEKE